MPADSPFPAPFDTSTFLFPVEWHAFSDLLGGADTGLICLQEGVITHVNRHLTERLGYDEAELVGQPVESLFAEGNAAMEGDPSSIRLRAKSGKILRFQFVANRIDALHDSRSTIWILRPESRSEDGTDGSALNEAIVGHIPGLVLVCAADTSLRFANRSFEEMTGGSGGMLSALVHSEDRHKLLTALDKAAGGETGASMPVSFRLRHHDGAWRRFAGEACRLELADDPNALLVTARDVTRELQLQQDIAADRKRQLHYLNRLLRLAQQPNVNLDSALKVILKAAAKAIAVDRCSFWEISPEPSISRCMAMYDDVRQVLAVEEPDPLFASSFHPLVLQVVHGEQQFVVDDVDQDPRTATSCEYFHAHGIKAFMAIPVPRGSLPSGLLLFTVLGRARRWRKDEAEFGHNAAALLGSLFSQAERVRHDAQLRHLAHHDSLTGLPNRHYLFDQATDFFPKVTADARTLAAFFIDLDGFKNVNDTFGHAIGDELLKAAALRLKNVVRKDDVLVRLGGDEFMLLARNLSNMRIADDIAQQIVETMRGAFSLQGRELQVSASVGIALYPFDGADIDTLMKKADIAMYHAKSAGRDQYQMFAPQLKGSASQRSVLEADLRRAIDEHELVHYYQPQIDLRTGKVRCVEALLRWRHPQKGLLLPAVFLPVAEESGLIRDISAWVMNEACEQLNEWIMQGLHDFTLAINLSASQLMDRSLVPELEDALERTGVPSHFLEWEVKESTVMQHHTMASSMLDHIADLRIGLSIDDFGTGYSSMAYLRRYPVRKVKIDNSFVDGLPGEQDDRAITEAIISMAKPLGLMVVAEGVETPQQMEFLREHGCDIAQGYFFTQPLTAEQFETWVIRH
ncbi:EAL and GGDEF domain-containing protein [Noviherbaspirillum sp. ST9]|uniref:sensor domain-containing protein n=1 Tax=Noviherbaspirillum sp. ST9 TaxID=3401606 RepID=UPI003B58A79D